MRYHAVRAGDCIVACIVIPATIFLNIVPLFFCSIECYVRKHTAIRERIITDRHYTVGNGYTCKTTAIIERRTTDSRYAVADCYACKRTAILERRITDSRYAVGYRDTCKTTATRERRTTDSRYTVGNIHAFNGGFFLKRIIIDTRYRFAVIFGGNHNIRNILVYPCYGITFAINIQGIYLR